MSDDREFAGLIDRIRQGDADAARQLVQEYEPELRIMARVRLTDPRLRRVLDSMDVCQSILGNFFTRAASGQFDLDTPEQLMKLLATMVRNKVTDYARRQQADRRDTRRLHGQSLDELDVAGQMETPSVIVGNAEILERVREKLSPDERRIAELRRDGQNWQQIADELNGSPEALRKQFTRAMDRVTAELGLNDSFEE